MPRALLVITLLLSLPASADTLAEVRAALAPLGGTAPIRATVAVERVRKAEGRFANQTTNAAISFEALSDPGGLHITFPPAILSRAQQETREHETDPKKPESVRSAIADVDASSVADMLDFRASLLHLLAIGQTLSETRVTYRGALARLLVLKLTPKLTNEATSIFHVRFSEDRLNLWIGADGMPLAAERLQKGSAGFLFLRGEMNSRQAWAFARVADRLVLTRSEWSFRGSGFGQSSEGKTVQTLVLH